MQFEFTVSVYPWSLCWCETKGQKFICDQECMVCPSSVFTFMLSCLQDRNMFSIASLKPTLLWKRTWKPQRFNCTLEAMENSQLLAQQHHKQKLLTVLALWQVNKYQHSHNKTSSPIPSEWPTGLTVVHLTGTVKTTQSLLVSWASFPHTTVRPVHSSVGDVMECCTARLATGMLWF